MRLPQKKRGFRRIVVDDVAYDWGCEDNLDIRRVDQPHSSLVVNIIFNDPWLQEFETRMQRNSNPITPAFVAYAIQEIVRLGWHPQGQQSCAAKYDLGKFTWDGAGA